APRDEPVTEKAWTLTRACSGRSAPEDNVILFKICELRRNRHMGSIKTIEGNLVAGGARFGIVVSRFNSFVVESLLEGVLDTLRRHGADEGGIEIVRVPGAFEIPLAAQ